MSATLRLDHLAFPVYDAPASYRFYSEVLELPLVDALTGDDWGGRPWLMMFFATGGGQLLALCALRGATPPAPAQLPQDVRHFAFSVASAAEQQTWRERLERHGIAFSEETHAQQRSIYFKDPDGTVLEVTTPASEAQTLPDAAAAATVGRWLAGAARP
jgi:catechol 2,3-dioxygenase-like lactoylglutathione lyase family enzyme